MLQHYSVFVLPQPRMIKDFLSWSVECAQCDNDVQNSEKRGSAACARACNYDVRNSSNCALSYL